MMSLLLAIRRFAFSMWSWFSRIAKQVFNASQDLLLIESSLTGRQAVVIIFTILLKRLATSAVSSI